MYLSKKSSMSPATMVSIALFFAVCLGFSQPGQASSLPTLEVGADLSLVLPVGDWSQSAGVGYGAMARVAYFFHDHLGAVATIGYQDFTWTRHPDGDRRLYAHLPMLAGLDVRTTFGIHGSIMLGANQVGMQIDGILVRSVPPAWKPALMVGVGYRLWVFDFGTRLYLPNLAEPEVLGIQFVLGAVFDIL